MNLRTIEDTQRFVFDENNEGPAIIEGTPPLRLNENWNYSFNPAALEENHKKLLIGLCSLLDGKPPFSYLEKGLNAREVENYLREENHIPVFNTGEWEDKLIQNCLYRWSHRGISLFLTKNLPGTSKKWPESYLSQVTFLNDLFQQEIVPLMEKVGIKLHLIALEGKTAVIQMESKEHHFLLGGLENFLRDKIEKVSLNIVAEEESPS